MFVGFQSQSPIITDNKTLNGTGTGPFTGSITGLSPNKNYYVRAYATNSIGTSYGNEISITTLGEVPSALVTSATNIQLNSATINGSSNLIT